MAIFVQRAWQGRYHFQYMRETNDQLRQQTGLQLVLGSIKILLLAYGITNSKQYLVFMVF